MKKVFSSNADCIHTFAQRSQDEGRTPTHSVYFHGDKIYSYGSHYLLGEFINNGEAIIINDIGYSNSTAKHINILWGATRQYKQFDVTRTDLDTVHCTVISHKNSLANARKPELYITPILQLWESLNEFLQYTKAKKYKSNKKYKEIKAIVTALNDSPEEYKEKIKLASQKLAKAQKRKDARKLKERLIKFNSYEIDSFRVGNEDYLRLSEDGTKVETSQRVSVKRDNAKLLYKMIERGIDIQGKHIEHYTVTSINGTLKIGCHNINIDSMHKVGKLL
tara:strand:- start:595 stop:1428 length:834 start_codon:yes stop_codon:yes gene_type:complete